MPISVPSTQFDVIVFDFDDTLVQSSGVKRAAFFEIFPSTCKAIVSDVLTCDPDGSRYQVIPAMLEKARAQGMNTFGLTVDGLVKDYARRVETGVREAEEVPQAVEALQWAAEQASTYIFSMTPHDELMHHIMRRGWQKWVGEAFGFPNRKPAVLKMLLERHDCPPARAIVVGDGVSDAQAARLAGSHYLEAMPNWPTILMQGLVNIDDR